MSKKTMKRAVDRNLVKRWLRSCFRGQVASPKCVDVVVLARKHAQALLREGKRYEKVCKEWQSVFANL